MLNHWMRSLSARLWVTSIVALAACLVLLTTLVVYAFKHYPERMLGHHEVKENTLEIADGLRFDAAGRPVAVVLTEQNAWLFEVVPTELKYRVFDARGNLLLASSDVARSGPSWLPAGVNDTDGKILRIQSGARVFDIMALPVQHGDQVFYVQMATSARFVRAIVGQKIKSIFALVRTTIILAMIVFGVTLTFTLHRILRPLRDASRAAARITPRNLTLRLPSEGLPSEIKPLINAFNDALARLENGFAVQQQFLASAAHELQTPLTLVRGQIELQTGIDDKHLLFREIDLMSHQVRQLLHLAEVSESQNFSFDAVNIVDVAQDVIAYLERKADRKTVRLGLDAPAALPSIHADRSALFILLKNIVENAINVSPAGGEVRLTVDAQSVRVQDQGPGIRDEHLPFLFNRFWRAPDAQHDGAGLGLAICKEIATAHDWRLTVSRLMPGSRFEVWFAPAAAAG